MSFLLAIKSNRLLRSLLMLNILLLAGIAVVYYWGQSVRTQTFSLYETILKNQMHLIDIQQTIIREQTAISVKPSKDFAAFEDVVPFISLIEQHLSAAGGNVEIHLQSDEEAILKEKIAHYAVILTDIDPANLRSAVKALYDTPFPVDIRNMVISLSEGKPDSMQFLLRLHLL